MKIRTRLAFQFTVIVATILCLFSFAIYYFSADFREKDYYTRLKDRALTTAELLIRVEEIDYKLLRIIDRNTVQALVNERVYVFNDTNGLIYSNIDKIPSHINDSLLQIIRDHGEYQYKRGERDGIGLVYKFKEKEFVVISTAWDKYGLGKLRNLKIVLIAGLLLCIAATLFAGWFYSNQALRPIAHVIREVDEITVNKLNLRVDEGNRKDEIALLAITFNNMLDRLENAFVMQRSFVSNASHELRTPLTSISGQIEIALLKDRDKKEYQQILNSVQEDIQALGKLSNGLLDLALVSSDISVLKMDNVRVDEMLFQARADILKRNKEYSVIISIPELPDDEKKISVFGNERLLAIAFMNLMDNGCKYSPEKSVKAEFIVHHGNIQVAFTDHGIGISPGDLKNLFQPFYRADNARAHPGHGLGLSLCERIIHLHKGNIAAESSLGKGLTFTITIPSVFNTFN